MRHLSYVGAGVSRPMLLQPAHAAYRVEGDGRFLLVETFFPIQL